ncbi:MAG TPA: response regulator [Puia sp.]|nr:response regulator [Puia sp.]
MKKILVVDDDKDLLVNMKAFLKRQGYEVAVTTSCEEGLQILNSFKPDLIYMDIDVGKEDGREMCRKIKSQAEYKHIPVILISANHDALQLYKDYGANAFLEKPFQLSSFLSTLQNHLS